MRRICNALLLLRYHRYLYPITKPTLQVGFAISSPGIFLSQAESERPNYIPGSSLPFDNYSVVLVTPGKIPLKTTLSAYNFRPEFTSDFHCKQPIRASTFAYGTGAAYQVIFHAIIA